MTSKQITLIDVASGRYEANAVITTSTTGIDLPVHEWSVQMKRLQGGPSDGVDLIQLNNGHLTLSILPTRGMGVWKAECGHLPVKWDSPVQHPVHPSLVDQSRRGGIGWLDGFNELICRCGLGWHGAPGTDTQRDANGNVLSEQFLPLHGRIANLAAHQVCVDVDDSGLISVTGVIDETSVFGERLRLTSVLSTQAGSSEFAIHDTVTNIGGASAEAEMLYHCNLGTPLLGEGSTFHTAAERVVPRNARAVEGLDSWETFQGPTTGYAEQVYFVAPVSDESGKGLAVLRSPDRQTAVALRFETTTLPWFTLWKNTQAAEDGYCCGLEPSSSLPNNREFEREQGRVLTLQPNHSVDFRLNFQVTESVEQTETVVDEVQQLQQRSDRVTESAPVAELAPV
jgi:hypothetical protein